MVIKQLPSRINHVMSLRNTKTTAEDILLYANSVSGLHCIAAAVCKTIQPIELHGKVLHKFLPRCSCVFFPCTYTGIGTQSQGSSFMARSVRHDRVTHEFAQIQGRGGGGVMGR